MIAHAVGRLLEMVPVLLLFLALIFVIVHAAPGDPIVYLYGAHVGSAEALAQLRSQYGLDDPLWLRFGGYLGHLARGDMGRSIVSGHPVRELIGRHLPATLLLTAAGMLLALGAGVLAGVLAAHRPHTRLDLALTAASLLAYSVPTFALGLFLILALSLMVPLFPTLGMARVGTTDTGLRYALDVVHHLVLPAIVVAAWHLAIYARLTRASLLGVLRAPFIATARAKGLSERAVVLRHGLSNALLPIVTTVGLQMGSFVTGAIVTEALFAWPGMGYLAYTALLQRDYPLLVGVFLVSSVCVLLATLATDLLYGVLDPRIRY